MCVGEPGLTGSYEKQGRQEDLSLELVKKGESNPAYSYPVPGLTKLMDSALITARSS